MAKQPQSEDSKYMRRALRLARRGWGQTSPNPMVGAVVVRRGVVVGEGFHRCAGTPHAEMHALADAGSDARGATLYVTLEPCSTSGRTPPCTEALLAAGIERLVVGCLDPNPRHAGRGVEILRQRGVSVHVGVLEPACRELNEAFFCWVTRGRPFVLLKMAMTLDGRIATASGDSKWVTGAAARRHVQKLRQWADAVMVGAETVRQDNPALTVRTPISWQPQPAKLVWTRQASLPRDLAIWADPARPPRFVSVATAGEWQNLLVQLGSEDVTALLIEGGGELAAGALQAGAVDKVSFFVAPKILGGRGSRPVVGGEDPALLSQALGLRDLRVRRVGEDLLVTGYPAS